MANIERSIKQLRILMSLAKRLGIWIELGKELDYSYNSKAKTKHMILDGGQLNGRLDMTTIIGVNRNTNRLAHELGHYIIASPHRRKRKDYGIPQLKYKDSSAKKYKWDLEDVKAQMVQNELLKFIGAEQIKIAGEYKDELMGWWNSEGKVISNFVIDLVK